MRLLGLYRGAKSALKKSAPDSARHFAISLRELISHTLHLLSPDDEFSSWNRDSSLIHKGKPTRKGRLLYICREVTKGTYTKFVNADVDVTVKFINLFHEGAHSLESSFTEEQRRAMLRRAEGLLSYLIEIGFRDKS